jgi:hypothetical protein
MMMIMILGHECEKGLSEGDQWEGEREGKDIEG